MVYLHIKCQNHPGFRTSIGMKCTRGSELKLQTQELLNHCQNAALCVNAIAHAQHSEAARVINISIFCH